MNVFQKCALFALGAATIAACSSSPGPGPSVGLVTHARTIGYAAIGASDAVGYGATVPCTTASPALVADPTCREPGANGYVPDIRTDLDQNKFNVELEDLGISGAVIGPDIQAAGDMYSPAGGSTPCAPRTAANAIPANFLQNELPNVNPKVSFATIFAGGNDVNTIVNNVACGAGGTTQASITAYLTAEITAFGEDYASLATQLHAKAPGAIIVVANIPNFANVPYAFALSPDPQEEAELRTLLQDVSVAIDQNVINVFATKGIPVVDLQCNPASYDPANFYTDGFHPNDTGYALLAQQFVAQALATTPAAPASACAYQGLSSAPGVAPTSADVRTALVPYAIGSTAKFPRY